MRRDPRKLLYDMQDSCRFLLQFTADRTLEDLQTDRGFRSAVERELQIVGEALTALDKSDPQLAARISEHQRIIRFRHVLVHGYDIVEPAITWAIVSDKLPTLMEEVGRLLQEG
jgi:uncharacterized protein with HEPN domain